MLKKEWLWMDEINTVEVENNYSNTDYIKKSIDALLKQNARNVANFKTGSKHDLKTQKAFDNAWIIIENKITLLDPVFGKLISAQND